MNERVALRLNDADKASLTIIAAALNSSKTTETPWKATGATTTKCLRVALRVAAEAARRGDLMTP